MKMCKKCGHVDQWSNRTDPCVLCMAPGERHSWREYLLEAAFVITVVWACIAVIVLAYAFS